MQPGSPPQMALCVPQQPCRQAWFLWVQGGSGRLGSLAKGHRPFWFEAPEVPLSVGLLCSHQVRQKHTAALHRPQQPLCAQVLSVFSFAMSSRRRCSCHARPWWVFSRMFRFPKERECYRQLCCQVALDVSLGPGIERACQARAPSSPFSDVPSLSL